MKSDPQLREDVRRLQARVLQLEADLIAAKAATRTVEKIVEKPVRVIVDRVIEKPVTVTVEKVVEKQVKVRAVEYQDSPEMVTALARANDTIAKLRARQPEIVDRIVEKPVREVIEIVVEKPVTVVTERVVEKPIKVRVVEFQDNPQTLKELEAARKAIVELQARPPEVVVKTVTVTETVEKPVEKERVVYVDRPVEKIVERVVYVEKPVEKIVERIVEQETIKTVIENRPDPAVSRALAKAQKELAKLRSRPPQTITVERLVTVGHDELLAKVHKLQAELAEYKQEGS